MESYGNGIWFSHGSERLAGVAILKNNFNDVIMHSESDPYGHYMLLILNINNIILLQANISGYNSKLENDFLFGVLVSHIGYLNTLHYYFFMGGDFNITLDGPLHRWPPSCKNSSASNLWLFMPKFYLVDIWREKNLYTKAFTWSNKPCTAMSHINYWPICQDKNNISSNIITTPFTD